jgi:hypothetical protein
MTQTKFSFDYIYNLLEEYASNEVSIHILNNAETDITGIAITTLVKRQGAIYQLILIACGLDYGDKEQE